MTNPLHGVGSPNSSARRTPLRQLPGSVNPLLRHADERRESAQNRMADAITGFAGSMAFVYIHVVWFGCWIGFGVERYPFGLLTMIVSLEAIFLSTFVLISQNRADARRRVMADQQWSTVQAEAEQNEQLLALSEQMLGVIEEVRGFADLAQEDHEQNAELLKVCRRTLALAEDSTPPAVPAAGPSRPPSRTPERTAESPASRDVSSPGRGAR